MSTVLYYAPEDAFKVRPLVGMMERLGAKVTTCTDPARVKPEQHTFLVACGQSLEQHPWLEALLDRDECIALRLSTVPLPTNVHRTLDLRAWPARSADKQVVSLSRWLQRPDTKAPFKPHTRQRTKTAFEQRPERRVGSRARALMMLGGIVAVLFLAVLFEPPDPLDPGEQEEQYPVGSASLVAQDLPATSVAPKYGAAQRASSTSTSATASPGAELQDTPRSAQMQTDRSTTGHVCRARSAEARRAWQATLTWQHRSQPSARLLRCLKAPAAA